MRIASGLGGEIWRDRRGNIAVEFAIILPMLLLMTLGGAELALMMMMDASLEIGIAEASRSGSLSQFGTAAEREERVKTIVANTVGRWVPGEANLTISTHVYPSLQDINSPTWVDGNNNKVCDVGEGTCPPKGVQLTPGIGLQGSLVVYTVTARREGFTGIFQMIGLGSYTFSRQAVVLNE